MSEPHDRLPRLEHERHEHVTAWRLSPGGEAWQAFRGVQCTAALTLVAAMGDLPRCESPRDLMTFLGLMPSEHASGEPRRPGSLTKAGNTPARRGLGAGAWAYRSPAKGRRHLHLRLDKQPTVIQDSRWTAQGRLCTRSRRLVARGNHAHVVTVAIARELSGFLGAMAQEVPLVAENESGL